MQKALWSYVGSSFILHLVWENLQAPLYVGYESLRQHFLFCLRAAATGDMFFMLVIYVALATVHRDPLWVTNHATYSHPATWIIALFIGILLAVSFELWAVYVAERWQYTEIIPLIPVANVGITPILQMVFVPLLVLLLTRHFSRSL